MRFSRPPRRGPAALLALALGIGTAFAAAAEPVGRWKSAQVEGRPGAVTVNMVGEAGISANRVTIYCTPHGDVAASFARRPGMPAETPMALTLETELGTLPLSGVTNRYGVLVIEGPAAADAARLLAGSRREARAVLLDGPGLGPVNVVRSTKTIGRVLDACGPRPPTPYKG
ncbi:hypothetical protein LNKW23_22900 [Paralimibaculum aggregatum]|uniref:Uncharacterized protein n=1 Tax=Paralimibaculum aggregatum TaxID=3036245 RepID=A0ABQ6LMZ6_9RHOB|nr:hypothetical protein [Limibaculum sp. NKW23]GMG83077.1 hypothetical protein LNKW23_22900 [Limibaculum sp. NKW23]